MRRLPWGIAGPFARGAVGFSRRVCLMANKIGDLEDRIAHFIQESLHELDSIRSEESERLEQTRKRFRELTQKDRKSTV